MRLLLLDDSVENALICVSPFYSFSIIRVLIAHDVALKAYVQVWCFIYLLWIRRFLSMSLCFNELLLAECFLQVKPPHSTRPTQYPCSFFVQFKFLLKHLLYLVGSALFLGGWGGGLGISFCSVVLNLISVS